MAPHSLSRRDFLAFSATGVAALALPRLGRAASAFGRSGSAGFATFLSDPGLKPPTMTVNKLAQPSPGYVFTSSLTGPGQRGPMIMDNTGQPVWFRPVKTVAINFRVQRYQNAPVLTWWEGTISKIGTGQGENLIVDRSYRTIARVKAGNGYFADVHEFLLTPQGTGLITIYDEKQIDLRSAGGPASGNVLDSIIQEIDVKTGKVLFEWHSLDHIPLTDTYSPLLDPFDYFHINSIDVDLDGNLLVSARNTSAVYKLDRKTGEVLWTLGGRSTGFELGPNASFMFQHDARGHSDGTLTLFDDGTGTVAHQARGIRLGLDVPGRKCVLLQEYAHPEPLAVNAMGNAQVLPGNGMMVGFGTQPYVTEFGPGGEVRFDATFDGQAWNYRAFRDVWVGKPTTRPKAFVKRANGRATVHVSWNGSTETAFWRIVGGSSPATLTPLQTVARKGFETAITVRHPPPLLAVEALDRRRHVLARSKVSS